MSEMLNCVCWLDVLPTQTHRHAHAHTGSQSYSIATGSWSLMVLKSRLIGYQHHHGNAWPLGLAQLLSYGMDVRIDGWITGFDDLY